MEFSTLGAGNHTHHIHMRHTHIYAYAHRNHYHNIKIRASEIIGRPNHAERQGTNKHTFYNIHKHRQKLASKIRWKLLWAMSMASVERKGTKLHRVYVFYPLYLEFDTNTHTLAEMAALFYGDASILTMLPHIRHSDDCWLTLRSSVCDTKNVNFHYTQWTHDERLAEYTRPWMRCMDRIEYTMKVSIWKCVLGECVIYKLCNTVGHKAEKPNRYKYSSHYFFSVPGKCSVDVHWEKCKLNSKGSLFVRRGFSSNMCVLCNSKWIQLHIIFIRQVNRNPFIDYEQNDPKPVSLSNWFQELGSISQ